jgi:hypothetical protein
MVPEGKTHFKNMKSEVEPDSARHIYVYLEKDRR